MKATSTQHTIMDQTIHATKKSVYLCINLEHTIGMLDCERKLVFFSCVKQLNAAS